MMKQIALSIEEMKHLESLGLDTSDASMIYATYPNPNPNFAKYEPILTKLNVIEEFSGYIDGIEYTPAYTLQDILEKLPEIIETESNNFECHINLYQIYIDYRDSKHDVLLSVEFGETILDAAYQMILWCIENGYIKTNKQHE